MINKVLSTQRNKFILEIDKMGSVENNPNIKQLHGVNNEELTRCDKTNSRVDEQCPRGWSGEWRGVSTVGMGRFGKKCPYKFIFAPVKLSPLLQSTTLKE